MLHLTKKEKYKNPKYTGSVLMTKVIKQNKSQSKLHRFRNSSKEEKEWPLRAATQSNMVCKIRNFSSTAEPSTMGSIISDSII